MSASPKGRPLDIKKKLQQVQQRLKEAAFRAGQPARHATDRMLDRRNRPALIELDRIAATMPRRSVLAIGVYEPNSNLPTQVPKLLDTRHDLTVALGAREREPDSNVRKFTVVTDVNGLLYDNTNAVLELARNGSGSFPDWTIRMDSDALLPERFLDRFIAVAELLSLSIAGPAMTRASWWSWRVSRRSLTDLGRIASVVEQGPVIAFDRRAAEEFLPYPEEIGMGWGMDQYWACKADELGLVKGYVDCAPIIHPAPAGRTYDSLEADRRSNITMERLGVSTIIEPRTLQGFRTIAEITSAARMNSRED